MAHSPFDSSSRGAGSADLHTHAHRNLEFIRASMAAAGSYAVPGLAGGVIGLVGVGAALVAAIPGLQRYWVLIWLAAALVAMIGGAVVMVRQALDARALYRGPLRKFMTCLAPGLAAGGVLTVLLWGQGLYSLLPGTWLLLYGVSLVAASTMTSGLIAVMGVLFMLLGTGAYLLSLPWQNALLGIGFGGLHLLFGVLLARRGRER